VIHALALPVAAAVTLQLAKLLPAGNTIFCPPTAALNAACKEAQLLAVTLTVAPFEGVFARAVLRQACGAPAGPSLAGPTH
jgi:hypothetical protein